VSRVEAAQCDACGKKYTDEDIYRRMVRVSVAGNVHRHDLDLCIEPCWRKACAAIGGVDPDKEPTS